MNSTFTGTKSASFRIKTGNSNAWKNNLGPGQYDYIPTIGERAKLVQSQYKNPGSLKIPQLIPKKEIEVENIPPEKVTFDMSFQLNPLGKYFNSKYKNSKCGTIGKQKKEMNVVKVDENPGPG